MTRFEWQPEYAVGHEEIDRQHRGILAIMNHLYEVLEEEDSPERHIEGEAVFDALATYVSTHFVYEEDLMRSAGYPPEQFAEHRGKHDALLAKVQGIKAAYEGGNEEALAELLPFLYGDWLISHICECDHEYAPWVTGGVLRGA